MFLTELFTVLRELDEADKLRIIQFLATELVQQPSHLFQSDESYEVWSPYDAADKPQEMSNPVK